MAAELSSKPPIKVGFLGAAHSHASEKVKILRASPDYQFIGICEESATVRATYAPLGVKFLSREELFEQCTVVVVESPVRDHARDAKLALAAGKHVHVEKPPAVTLKGFQELATLAREKKLLLQVGYMWRFHPGLNAALEAARKGWLGEVYLVRGTINTQIAANRRAEWGEFKGGAMFELGCHLIDPVVRLLGRPAKVTPFLKRHAGADLADNTTVVFEFPKATASVTTATLQPNAGAHRAFEILGTNGTAVIQPIEPPVLQIDLAKAAGPYQAGTQTIPLPAYRRYVGEFAELAEAIRNQKLLSIRLQEESIVHETLLRACEML